ncbi:MAG: hypothetical protein K0S99_442, partial [Thermomicrobiales bacterium]|nr:hypothetical protein [Thermomicrobiales bacterium]
HRSVTITADVYGHVAEGMTRDAAELLGTLFGADSKDQAAR